MKAKELIEILEPYKDKDIEFIYYSRPNQVEIWTDEGSTFICEIDLVEDEI